MVVLDFDFWKIILFDGILIVFKFFLICVFVSVWLVVIFVCVLLVKLIFRFSLNMERIIILIIIIVVKIDKNRWWCFIKLKWLKCVFKLKLLIFLCKLWIFFCLIVKNFGLLLS